MVVVRQLSVVNTTGQDEVLMHLTSALIQGCKMVDQWFRWSKAMNVKCCSYFIVECGSRPLKQTLIQRTVLQLTPQWHHWIISASQTIHSRPRQVSELKKPLDLKSLPSACYGLYILFPSIRVYPSLAIHIANFANTLFIWDTTDLNICHHAAYS